MTDQRIIDAELIDEALDEIHAPAPPTKVVITKTALESELEERFPALFSDTPLPAAFPQDAGQPNRQLALKVFLVLYLNGSGCSRCGRRLKVREAIVFSDGLATCTWCAPTVSARVIADGREIAAITALLARTYF